jgi:hypothetical protein
VEKLAAPGFEVTIQQGLVAGGSGITRINYGPMFFINNKT